MSSSASGVEKKESAIVVLDWDDTLFPTTDYDSGAIDPYFVNGQAALRRLENAVIGLLAVCLSIAQVKIVSNGSMDCLRYSMLTYMPSVRSFIEANNIKVISARDLLAHASSDRVYWKSHVFLREIFRIYRATGAVNFLSIGDGDPELEAVRNLRCENPATVAKCVRLRKQPSVAVLEQQMKWLKSNVVHLMRLATPVERWVELPVIDLKSLGRTAVEASRAASSWAMQKLVRGASLLRRVNPQTEN